MSSRTRSLNRATAFGARRLFGCLWFVKLNPRNFRCHGRATALFSRLTRSLGFVVESGRVLIAPFIPLAGSVRAFTACAATTPSADSCHRIRGDLSLLSLDSKTDGRSPEVSSTAFDAQPLDLHSVPLVDVGFAAIGQLARILPASYPVLVHRLASLLHASFRPHLTVRPLRFAITSPPSGCEEDLHLQAVDHARHTEKNGAQNESAPR